jgi:hypothetical protein
LFCLQLKNYSRCKKSTEHCVLKWTHFLILLRVQIFIFAGLVKEVRRNIFLHTTLPGLLALLPCLFAIWMKCPQIDGGGGYIRTTMDWEVRSCVKNHQDKLLSQCHNAKICFLQLLKAYKLAPLSFQLPDRPWSWWHAHIACHFLSPPPSSKF